MTQHDAGQQIMSTMDPQPDPAAVERIRDARRRRIDGLLAAERDWRLHPGDGGDPAEVSGTALRRELALDAEIARRDLPADLVPAARDRLKHFPVLFVSAPHIEDGVTGSFPGMPTSLLYATSVLDRLTAIDEFPAGRVPRTVAVMNPATWNDVFERELVDRLRADRPELVGISNLSESHHFALRIARLVKRELPAAIVLLGGQHEDGTSRAAYEDASDRAAAMAGRRRDTHTDFLLSERQRGRLGVLETLSNPADREAVDLVFAGDAPFAVVEVLRVVAEAGPGAGAAARVRDGLRAARDRFAALPGRGSLSYWDPQAARIERLTVAGPLIDGNDLPYIDVRRLTQQNRFAVFGHRLTAQIMACLGCKYACAFCYESADAFLFGTPKFRQRTVAHVAGEIAVRQAQGYRAVFFDDSTFTQNPRWLDEMLGHLSRLDTPIEWACQTTINDVDAAMLHRMRAAGCSYVYFGIESDEPDPVAVQKVSLLRTAGPDRNWTDRLRRVALWCRDAGVRMGTSLQFGLGESPAERTRTLQLIAGLHRDGCIPDGCVALNINSPYPGTLQWLRLLDSATPVPQYRERLVRHTGFETAHQFSALRGAEVDELYTSAAAILGGALHLEGQEA